MCIRDRYGCDIAAANNTAIAQAASSTRHVTERIGKSDLIVIGIEVPTLSHQQRRSVSNDLPAAQAMQHEFRKI